MENLNKQTLALELLTRCMKISENTPHDVFFEFAPHINAIEVHIHLHGWKNDKNGSYITIRLNDNVFDTRGQFDMVNAALDTLEENKQ